MHKSPAPKPEQTLLVHSLAGLEWAGQPFLRCPIPGSYSEGEISAVQLEF